MGRRGPKKTPTALTIARGNPGKRPLNHEEPQLPPPDLTPPDGLEGEGLREWQELGPVLLTAGVLTMGDVGVFKTYCRIVEDEVRYEALSVACAAMPSERIKVDGFLLKIRGQKKQYAAELGITPSSRSGIKAKKPVDPADERRKRFFPMAGGQAGGPA